VGAGGVNALEGGDHTVKTLIEKGGGCMTPPPVPPLPIVM